MAVIPAGAAETKLTSVYASYAAEGHTNAPVADDVFEAKSDSITVSILTTTDMHGRAYDWNSYTNSALSNNFLQAAKLVAERRAAVDDSILIDVGDILQGSALSSYNILQEGGENSPMATALRYIGYDAFVLGNHEFNYAPQIQWNYYNLLTSTDKAVAGQPVDVICSNVVETETNESVFSPYKTFTYKFEDGTTFTIGLLGFENMNNANWDVASHYEGCTFGHPDNTEKSYVYEWENYYGKEMQEKCASILFKAGSLLTCFFGNAKGCGKECDKEADFEEDRIGTLIKRELVQLGFSLFSKGFVELTEAVRLAAEDPNLLEHLKAGLGSKLEQRTGISADKSLCNIRVIINQRLRRFLTEDYMAEFFESENTIPRVQVKKYLWKILAYLHEKYPIKFPNIPL